MTDPRDRVPARAPSLRSYKDMPVVTWTGDWSTESIRSAIDSHDQGQFLSSALLCETVQRDDRVSTALNTRAKGLLGLPVTITPSTRTLNVALATELADKIRDRWETTNWLASLIQQLRWQILLGFSLCELIWRGDWTGWEFDLKVWHPTFLFFNWATRCYYLNTQEGMVEVTGGDGKWFFYAPEGEYRAWITGAIRTIGIPWLGRQYALRDWLRFDELYGLALVKAKIPSHVSEEDKNTFFDGLTNRGSEMVVMCPQGVDGQGFDLELVEATATGWQTFQAATQDCDKRITLAILGQNLTTEVQGGSFAAASVHGQVRQDYLEADARALAQQFCAQALRWWALYNYGDADLAPTVAWDTAPPDDLKARADTLAQVSTAMLNLASTPEIDRRALLESFSIPLLAEADTPAPAPQPAQDGPAQASVVHASRVHAAPAAKAAQAYVDDAAGIARDRAARVLKPDVEAVLAAIDGAGSYEDVRTALTHAYNGMDPGDLAAITEHVLLLSQLAGAHAVHEDVHGESRKAQ